MFKKSISLILAAVLAAALFSGFAQAEGSNQLVLSITPDAAPGLWEETLEAFQKAYPDIELVVDMEQGCSSRLQPLMVAGTPPDVTSTNHFEFDLFGAIVAGQYQSVAYILNDTVEGTDQTYADLFDPSLFDTVTINGEIMLAPIGGFLYGIVYDQKLLRDNGIDPPKTHEEFMAAGAKLAEQGIALMGYPGVYSGYVVNTLIGPSIYAYGGAQAYFDTMFVAAKGGWQSDAVKRALQDFVDLRDAGYLLNGTVAIDHIQTQMEVLNRRVGFISTGSWFVLEMGDAIPEDFEAAYMAAPARGEAGLNVVGGYQNYVGVPAKAKNPENAKKFIQFLYTPEVQLIFCKYGLVPGLKNTDAEALSKISDFEQGAFTLAAQDGVAAADTLASLLYPTLFKVLTDNINLLAMGEISIDQFCEEAEAEAENIRNNPDIPKFK